MDADRLTPVSIAEMGDEAALVELLKRALSLLTRMTLHDNAPQDWGERNGTALILELTYRDGTVRTVAYFDGCLRIEGEAPPQGGRWLTVEGRPDLAARMQAL